MHLIKPLWKGIIPYTKSLHLQEQMKKQVTRTTTGVILGFECPPCITLGLRGDKKKDLTQKPEVYKNMEIVSITRGGQATLHSPGQLVIYPILDLLKFKIRLKDFLTLLENITLKTFSDLGITLHRQENSAGLFTSTGKIAFFGVHVSQGVSQHGLALNVSNDLTLFKLIRSCGNTNRKHDSLKQRGLKIGVKDLFFKWTGEAKKKFILKT